MGKKAFRKANRAIERMDKKSRMVYDYLLLGKSKKEVANLCKVDLDYVHTIAKRYHVGRSDVEAEIIEPFMGVVTDNVPFMIMGVNELVCDNKEDETMVVQKEKRSTSRRLTDDEVIGILEDVELGMTNAEIAEKYNISVATVNTKKKEFGLSTTRSSSRKVSKNKFTRYYNRLLNGETTAKKIQEDLGISPATYQSYKIEYEKDHPKTKEKVKIAVEEEGVKKPKHDKPVDGPVEVSFTKTLAVGLVAGRHYMPVSNYIFENVDNDLMFDYELQDQICKRFVSDNLMNDGVVNVDLVVYVTGLQCVLASLIKITREFGVNLELRHYEAKSNSYRSQVIWNDNKVPGIKNQILSTLTKGDRYDYLFGCSEEDIMHSDHFYIIVESEYDDNENRVWKDQTFVTNYDKIWMLFGEKVARNNNPGMSRRSVFIYDISVENGKYHSNTISKSFNFKS